jgi:hypothetical protein
MKTFSLLAFSLVWQFALCQNLDSLVALAQRNPRLYYNAISRHYPLEEDHLTYLGDQLSWWHVSQNPNLPWSETLMTKFAHRFHWAFLGQNPGIKWTTELHNKFYHLVGLDNFCANPNFHFTEQWIDNHIHELEWYYLANNPSFLADTALVNKYRHHFPDPKPVQNHKLLKSIICYNCLQGKSDSLTAELLLHEGDSLKDVDFVFLKRNARFLYNNQLLESDEINLTMHQAEQLVSYMTTFSKYYVKYFAPHLDSTVLFQIYTKYHKPQLYGYYPVRPSNDYFGIIQDAVPIKSPRLESAFPVSLSDSFQMEPLMLKGWEPPVRFSPIYQLNSTSQVPQGFSAMIVSESVKAIFESYQLPPHRFYPFTLSFSDEHYGSDSRTYYLFYTQNLGYNSLDLTQMVWRNTKTHQVVFEGETDTTKMLQLQAQIYKTGQGDLIKPDTLVFQNYFDLISSRFYGNGRYICVSDRMRKHLEYSSHIGPITFELPLNTPIKTTEAPEPPVSIAKRRDTSQWQYLFEQGSVQKFINLLERRKEILSKKADVISYRKANPCPYPNHPRHKVISQKEQYFGVIFPQAYWDLSCGQGGIKYQIGYYDLILPERLLRIEDWSKNYPFAVKHVLIAEDGGGDYLGYLLKLGSSFELSPVLYEFQHEIGDIVPYAGKK